MRRLIVSLCLLAGVASLLAMAAGCAPKITGAVKANHAPHTRIFVQGPVDPVNHLAHLYWLGADDDGYVKSYEIKLVNPADPVAADSAWVPTTKTDSVFTVYTPAGAVAPILYVRSVDNMGLKDDVPARQVFQFHNNPPIVTLTTKPNRTDKSDSTYASVTVTWSISDADGDATKAIYHVWLDGNAATYDVTTNTTFTVPSSRFLQGGVYKDGFRTLYVQGIDDGGMAGPVDSVRWYVRQPNPSGGAAGSLRGRLLLIDEVPRAGNSNTRIDTLYQNAAIRNLPPGTWSTLQLEYSQPFHSALDMEQTFKLFDGVVWYRGVETSISSTLHTYEDGIGNYLKSGGKLFLSGLYLFSGPNADGGLSEDFTRNYLDCDGFRLCYQSSIADSSASWNNTNGSLLYSTMYADSSVQQGLGTRPGGLGGWRVFKTRNAAEVAFYAVPGAIAPALPESLAVGVSVPQPGGGRAVVLSFPPETSLPPVGGPAPRILAKIFAQLGLVGP